RDWARPAEEEQPRHWHGDGRRVAACVLRRERLWVGPAQRVTAISNLSKADCHVLTTQLNALFQDIAAIEKRI
ncbi:unnamed protein product, partial [Symbiodinium sp. KB8]